MQQSKSDGPDLAIERIGGLYSICRLDPEAELPVWAIVAPGRLVSITRTERELSIVAPQGSVPPDVTSERGWIALRVAGTLDFDLVGVLARLTGALADAEVTVIAISTYDTDILLVRSGDLPRAIDALATVADVRRIA